MVIKAFIELISLLEKCISYRYKYLGEKQGEGVEKRGGVYRRGEECREIELSF